MSDDVLPKKRRLDDAEIGSTSTATTEPSNGSMQGPSSNNLNSAAQLNAYYAYMYQFYNAYAPYRSTNEQETPDAATGVSSGKTAADTRMPPSRTIYLGNIPAGTSFEEIFNCIKHGVVDSCRMLPEKNCAFIDFVDINGAIQFFTEYSQPGSSLHIRRNTIRVAYGKSSTVQQSIQTAVASGASRVLYLSGLSAEQLTQTYLRSTLEMYGIIELVKILLEKKTAFVYYVSIKACIAAVQALTVSPDPAWKGIKIGYGKDRCNQVKNPSAAASAIPGPTSISTMMMMPSLPYASSHQALSNEASSLSKIRNLEKIIQDQSTLIESQASLIRVCIFVIYVIDIYFI